MLGEASEEYNQVFKSRAKECGSKLIYAQEEFACEVIGKKGEDCPAAMKMQEMLLTRGRDGKLFRVNLDLMGEWQSRNVVTASAALDYLHRNRRQFQKQQMQNLHLLNNRLRRIQ